MTITESDLANALARYVERLREKPDGYMPYGEASKMDAKLYGEVVAMELFRIMKEEVKL